MKRIAASIKRALILGGALFLPHYTNAQPGGTPTGGGFTLPNPLGSTQIMEILDRIIDFLLLVAAPVAIVMTIWAGYLFITASDNEARVKKARTTLLFVVIGVAILIFSKGMVNLIADILNPTP